MAIRIEQQSQLAVGQIGEGPDPADGDASAARDRQIDAAEGHPCLLGVSLRRPQLHVAEAVDPDHLDPRVRRPSASAVLGHGGGRQADQRSRVDGGPQLPSGTPRARARRRPGRRGRGRRMCRAWSGPPMRARRHGRSIRRRPIPPPRSGARCPGRRRTRAAGPGDVTSRQTPRRPDPTPGSTTASTTPGPRYGAARTRAMEPARTSNAAIWCVRSTMATPGEAARRTAWTTPTNSSSVP